MNPVPTVSTWLQLAVLLGAGTAAVVLAAALLGRWTPNARWERAVWLAALLSLAVLLLAELTGWSSAVLTLSGARVPLRREAAPSDGQGLTDTGPRSAGMSGGRTDRPAGAGAVPANPLDSPHAGASALAAKDRPPLEPGINGKRPSALLPGTLTESGHDARHSEDSSPGAAAAAPAGLPGRTDRAVEDSGARQTGRRQPEPGNGARSADAPLTQLAAHSVEQDALWQPGVVWLLGAVVLAGRALVGQVLAFCWRGVPVRDEALCQRIRHLAERLGIRRRVRVVVGRRLAGPIALGIFRPTIGLPAGFTSDLDPAQQEAVLAHELGHLAVRDPAWHLFANLLTAALWWHPLVWWSRQRFQQASEAAADETCLLLADGPVVLAECLVALAGRRVRAQGAGLAIGGRSFRSNLGRRVERLLHLPTRSWEPLGWAWPALLQTLGAAALAASVIVGTSWIRPAWPERGDTPMNLLHTSWKRSLAACVLLLGFGPERASPAAEQPDEARTAAPKSPAVPAKAVADADIAAAVKLINEQLRRDFPEAPLLAAGDLLSAEKRSGDTVEIVLERRGVATDRNPFSFVYARVERPTGGKPKVTVKASLAVAAGPQPAQDKPYEKPLNGKPAPVAADGSVRYDYDIVYVRAPRVVKGKDGKDHQAQVWPNAAEPESLRAPTDLMLLHPDGSEEVLVAGGQGAIADPYVSFDAQWVYYTYFHDTGSSAGADVYKVHVGSRKTMRLTQQQWTPNTGVPDWSAHFRTQGNARGAHRGVYNMHPCPLPGGRVAFVSNRDGLKAPRLAQGSLQLFVMDDDGANVEKIGHLNVGQALHPVILKDGRIIFSSLEVQGKHNTGWGILGIHPDGTNWNPVVSALSLGGAPIPFHFQTQLSDGSIVVENYYTPAMGGFGVYFKQPPQPPEGIPPFGPAKVQNDPKMIMMRSIFHMPFQPYGMEVLTRFTHNHDSPSLRADPRDPKSPHAGWVTQPCGAPDNHLLTVWSGMMPANQGRIIDNYGGQPVDAGIYLIKGGRPLWDPGEMLLIKNDPKYNEQWPRPLVPYKRIYGTEEPRQLPTLRNDGKLSKHLPEGTPFGLVGTSSLYKRESYPLGEVRKGSVTATGAPYSAFPTREHRTNWDGQGADAGLYTNSDIHAIRILAMEPASIPVSGKFSNHAGERLRILGEIPVRKLNGDQQPVDPDGNPDTSFLAKIPADMAWTFQTLDRDGMVLNMAQTWHQLRPGEIRTNCGGCHAHSQKPTLFQDTAAARPDYALFDLTKQTPLLTTKANDQSGKKWDLKDETGLRFAKGVLNVEYHRDIRPIFERSCVACHSGKSAQPAGNLVLDDDKRMEGQVGAYRTLVHPKDGKATRYLWPSQSRNSLLTWKVFGRRTDGFPEKLAASAAGDYQGHLNRGGLPYSPFKGSIMPPPEAVAGAYDGPDGKKIKVAPLTDEDRRTLVRWIDLGCPLDGDYNPQDSRQRGRGWMLDDQRPTLTLTYPKVGVNESVTRFLVGMYDYDTGLDLDSFTVVADFPVAGVPAGGELAGKFKPRSESVWELALTTPLPNLPKGNLRISVKDRQGNTSRIVRTFSVPGSSPK